MSDAFTWGSGGNKLTPNDRRRRMAEAMLKAGSDYSPVQHWTQGLARLANALIGGYQLRQADDIDRAGAAALANEPVLNPALLSAAAVSSPSFAGDGSARTMAMPSVTPEIKDGIVQTASALGISPVDLATTISYETAGTFDPTKAGPRTQWGQHRGLIQFGEPQAAKFGVDWSNPVASQLGPNGAVAAYLKDAGVKPGMGLMDIYSAINAGGVGRYGASDANNGGAPGTVADKVNSQMAGHRAKAQRLFADIPAAGASPVSMETGQDGFAVPPAPAPAMSGATFNAISAGQPLDPVFTTEGISQPWMGTALAPAAPSAPQMAQAPLPPARPTDLADIPAQGAVPAMGQVAPVAAPAAAPVVVDPNSPDGGMRALIAAEAQGGSSPFSGIAQALMGGGQASPAVGGNSVFSGLANALAGGSSTAPTTASPAVQRVAQAVTGDTAQLSVAASPGSDRVASAMRVLNSPYAQPGQRAVAQMVVQQAFRDPAETEMKRLQLDKARRDAEAAPLDLEGRKLDIETKRKNLGKAEAPTVQRIKQPDGSEVAVQWDQNSKAWVPLVAPEGGNAVKAPQKLTEAQSKDLTYFNRGVQALEAFEKDADAYANGLERGASQLPGGNYLNSDQFQRAKQSGRNFLASILRKDSGAAITENEEKIYGDVFLPQPGDKPGVLAQKREARRQAIEAVKGGLGTAEVLARGSEVLKAPAPTAAPDRAALEAEARRRGLIK